MLGMPDDKFVIKCAFRVKRFQRGSVGGPAEGVRMADIAVLLKQVPDTNAKILVSGNRVDETAVSKWSMSPYDEFALEAALQSKESTGGSVTVITCGPARAAKMLTDAAAVGADNLMHITVDDLTTLDSLQVQSLLAAGIEKSGAEIVFCGKQAADTNAGSTGPGVAELMGIGCATMISEVTIEGDSCTALRPTVDGAERIGMTVPCVLAFDKTQTVLRRPNVKGIMMAKRKKIESVTPEDLGVDLGTAQVIIGSHAAPAQKPAGQKFEGAESVPEVVAKLREEAKVL
jgi:electron transfer flavoprotein beta subunit